jgi:very-short-patch-repair endonuclease
MRPQSRTHGSDGSECGVRDVPDQVIARLAEDQFGVVSHPQLVAAGVSSGAIKRRVRIGRLHPVHRGVYLVGHAVTVRGGREMAAVLACGTGAVVSHRTAACLWALLPYPANQPPVDITLAGRDPGTRRGIRVHRVRSMDSRDTRTLHRIPITTPARTLLDLATALPPPLLETAVAEAQVRRLVRKRDLIDQLERNRGRRGTRAVRQVLNIEGAPAFTRSEAERKLLSLLRASELPMPQVNARLGRHEVDFLWREQQLVVEVDGFRFHSSRASFEGDRHRDAALAAIGYTVLRITWRQLVAAPEAVVARMAAALASRGGGE